MKNKELKLCNKYKHDNYPNKEFIYIGMGVDNCYWFIYKHKNFNIHIKILNKWGLNMEQVIKDLNLETFIDKNGIRLIKEYNCHPFNEKDLIDFKPLLKDKLKNIINR